MYADWEVDVIEVSSTTLMLHGYLVRVGEICIWFRVDTFAMEGLDGQRGCLLYGRIQNAYLGRYQAH